MAQSTDQQTKVHYAVVGLGWIAQEDVLPAFARTENSELVALVSSDPVKLETLGEQYEIQQRYSYDQYEQCLNSGDVDAVYIALPNHLHCEYVVKAAQAGIHILCEKPMAVDEAECQRMIEAAAANQVKLMIAYRLHFDRANMEAVKIAQSGQLGDLRIFNSVFTQQVEADNVRLEPLSRGGGSVYDMGVYCINAARYLFQDEPTEVVALSANNGESRFSQCDEMTSVILRFPCDRIATFTSSFGTAPTSTLQIFGTKGNLRMDSAYTYMGELHQRITVGNDVREQTFSAGDQFAAEITYFSDCVLTGNDPEPSGREGLNDVAIIRAITQSAQMEGHPIKLADLQRSQRPNIDQVIQRPAPDTTPELVHAAAPFPQS